MDEAYTLVRKKNIFVAEAEDPMRIRDTGVNQYLPQRLQKNLADIKVPVKQPAPVQQVPEDNDDLHTVRNLKDFDYLKSLPKFLFGNIIALEVENSISEQLEFKKYLSEFLNNFLKDEI